MSLNFPNASRSYDLRLRRVRFWAHDESLEVPFFVEVAALLFLDPQTARDEAGVLDTFDLNRSVIQTVAARAYARNRRDSYTLTASDFA